MDPQCGDRHDVLCQPQLYSLTEHVHTLAILDIGIRIRDFMCTLI